MKFVTVQASAFKTAFEVLKDILNDTNIYFEPNGFRILTLDTARAALVDMFLPSTNFEVYECTSHITAGINVSNMYKLMKTITNNDTLTFEITDRDYLHIKIENTNKKTSTKFQLKLLDINEDIIEAPVVKMSVITTLPSVDFQRICRDMNNIGSDVDIIRHQDKFIIRCQGDFANQETIIESNDEYNEDKLEGRYSLKYINMFTKATTMCSSVQIMQESDNRFLILRYHVANLGYMNFYLATKVDE